MINTTPYKVIALDLDGTLTNARKEITPATRSALLEAQQRGVRIILASGRPVFGIAPLADELRLSEHHGYIMAYNGGQIIDWSTREVVGQQTLDPEVLPYFYECACRGGFEILTYDGDDVICEHPENQYVQYECMLNKMKARRVEHFLEAIHEPKPKCLIVGDPEPLARLEAEMAERLRDTNGVYRSEAFFLELVPKGIDKALSLERLFERVGFSREELIACGDGYNDLSMIRYAGLGVAMANAKEEVKAAADYITLSNEEDGVAAVVQRYLLSEK
jgi:Cof subfamily protein (haloacid dehalogenase superfamily)